MIIDYFMYIDGGAASGATGAAILKAAGKVGYSVLEGARVGAAGNAVVGPVMSIAAEIVERYCSCEDESTKKTKRDALVELILSIGTSTLGGMLGHAMLAPIAEMSLEQTAAALAVGSSTIIGGTIVTVLVVGGCVAAGAGIAVCCEQTSDVTVSSTPRHFPSFGFFGTNSEEKAAADIEAPENQAQPESDDKLPSISMSSSSR